MAKSAFAAALKQARYEAEMTAKELSALSGVSLTTITRWEGGHLPQRTLAVVKVARALGVDNDRLLIPMIDEYERRVKGK